MEERKMLRCLADQLRLVSLLYGYYNIKDMNWSDISEAPIYDRRVWTLWNLCNHCHVTRISQSLVSVKGLYYYTPWQLIYFKHLLSSQDKATFLWLFAVSCWKIKWELPLTRMKMDAFPSNSYCTKVNYRIWRYYYGSMTPFEAIAPTHMATASRAQPPIIMLLHSQGTKGNQDSLASFLVNLHCPSLNKEYGPHSWNLTPYGKDVVPMEDFHCADVNNRKSFFSSPWNLIYKMALHLLWAVAF